MLEHSRPFEQPASVERRANSNDAAYDPARMSEQVHDWHNTDRYVIDQLIRPMANLYRVTAGGSPVVFVRQKRLAVKEDIRFFADENEHAELFRIKARSLMELGGRYDITSGRREDRRAREVLHESLFRSTWRILDANEQEVGIAQERSVSVAFLRRVADFFPYADFVPIPFHFTFDAGDRIWATSTARYRDTYDLDLSGDPDRTIDRRLAIALA